MFSSIVVFESREIVGVTKDSCEHPEFTKREERVERRYNEGRSLRAMNSLIGQRERSWFGKIVKGLIIQRWSRVSFGESTWDVSWKLSLISADCKSTRRRSEGRKKAAIARRKANFFCKKGSGVDMIDWICRKWFRVEEMSIVGRWICFGGSLWANVSRRLFTMCSSLSNEALFWWKARNKLLWRHLK